MFERVFSFWKRRVVRIYQALLVCILATTVVYSLLEPPFPLSYLQWKSSHRARSRGRCRQFVFVSWLSSRLFQRRSVDQPFSSHLVWGLKSSSAVLFSMVFLALPVLVAALFGAREGSAVKMDQAISMRDLHHDLSGSSVRRRPP